MDSNNGMSKNTDTSLNYISEALGGILDSMHDGVYITDNKGKTLFVNDSYTKLSGLKKEDLIGEYMNELIKKGYFLSSASLSVLKEKKAISIIDSFKNGKKGLVTSCPVFDENNEIIMVVTNLRDMTKLIELENRLQYMEDLNEKYYFEAKELRKTNERKYNMVGNSKSIINIYEMIDKIAEVDATVLILGQTGVGKEEVAREIHKNSLRKGNPFIKINCASIPDNLFESELFGYAKGAFTGADNKGKPGLFELAEHGTILLDEIGELSLNSQSKILRVLQEKQIIRVGGTEVKKIDVRIIAATNRTLKTEVKNGTFREDLFYRLNVIPITVPSLEERREDIPLLSKYFLDLYNSRYNRNKVISNSAYELLKWYSWPGNVRQLMNTIERLVLIWPQYIITEDAIMEITGNEEIGQIYNIGRKEITLNEAVNIVEKQLVFNALKKHGTTRKAADALGVSQPTVVRKAKQYKIEVEI